MAQYFWRGPRWLIAAQVVLVGGSFVALLPHLFDDVWQDEAVTLMFYAAQGFWYPFSDYSLPNNHPLFSAVLAAWWQPGASVPQLRALPALLWGLSLACLLVFGRGLLGRAATAIALALWGGSAVTAAFALALRGYAFSWPFVLIEAAAAVAFIARGNTPAAVGFTLVAAANVAIVPTNLLVTAVCIAWATCIGWTEHAAQRAACVRRAGLAVLLGAAGLLVFLPHLAQLRQHAQMVTSHWSSAALSAHWLLATLGQYALLAPLAAGGLVVGRRARRVPARPGGWRALQLLGVLSLLVPAALALLPVAVFPRTLVPLLPLWYLALGGVLAHGITALARRAHQHPRPWLVVLLALVFVCGRLVPACGGRFDAGAGEADLCQQYYHRDYYPAAMLAAVVARVSGVRPRILLDAEAQAVAYYFWVKPTRPLLLVGHLNWRAVFGDSVAPDLVLSHSPDQVRRALLAVTARTPARITVALDTGYFKLYRVGWP